MLIVGTPAFVTLAVVLTTLVVSMTICLGYVYKSLRLLHTDTSARIPLHRGNRRASEGSASQG